MSRPADELDDLIDGTRSGERRSVDLENGVRVVADPLLAEGTLVAFRPDALMLRPPEQIPVPPLVHALQFERYVWEAVGDSRVRHASYRPNRVLMSMAMAVALGIDVDALRCGPPAVQLVRQLAEVDLRMAGWAWLQTWMANEPNWINDHTDRFARWCVLQAALDNPPHEESLTDSFERRPHWLPALRRQVRPLRVANPMRLVRRASPALQVAWDATVDGHAWPVLACMARDPIQHAHEMWRRVRMTLPRLTAWLQSQQPDGSPPWTLTRVWHDPVGRMLCERSTLEALP